MIRFLICFTSSMSILEIISNSRLVAECWFLQSNIKIRGPPVAELVADWSRNASSCNSDVEIRSPLAAEFAVDSSRNVGSSSFDFRIRSPLVVGFVADSSPLLVPAVLISKSVARSSRVSSPTHHRMLAPALLISSSVACFEGSSSPTRPRMLAPAVDAMVLLLA